MQDERFSPIQLLLSCFGVSSMAGISRAIRSGEPVEFRKLVGVGMYSGIIGLLVAMLLYDYIGSSNYILLIGVSGLAGLGGNTVLDFILNAWSGGGINITFRPAGKPNRDDGKDDDDDDDGSR